MKYKVLVPVCVEFQQEADSKQEAADKVVLELEAKSQKIPVVPEWRGGLMMGFPFRVPPVLESEGDLVLVDVTANAVVPCEVFEED